MQKANEVNYFSSLVTTVTTAGDYIKKQTTNLAATSTATGAPEMMTENDHASVIRVLKEENTQLKQVLETQ